MRDNAQMRALLRATYEIQAQIADRHHTGEALLDEAERLIFALRRGELHAKQRLLEHAVADEIDRLENAARDHRRLPGLATGLPDLDRLLGGLQNGRLYVLAGRPAMGKSLLALQLARYAATVQHARVLFASLEMSDSETAQRHLATESGVDPDRLHLANLRDQDWPPLLHAANHTLGIPFHLLDDGDLSLLRLRAQARQIAVREHQLGLIVVDYLQLMRAERPTGNRVEDVSEFSRGLKRLARELACPVIAVAQLSRAVEQRPDKRPLLSDLRESGQIEADADCVLMLYRDDYYDPDSDQTAPANWTSSSAKTAKAASDMSQPTSTTASAINPRYDAITTTSRRPRTRRPRHQPCDSPSHPDPGRRSCLAPPPSHATVETNLALRKPGEPD